MWVADCEEGYTDAAALAAAACRKACIWGGKEASLPEYETAEIVLGAKEPAEEGARVGEAFTGRIGEGLPVQWEVEKR